MRARGGTLLALSVDAPGESHALASELELPYRVLSDAEREVVRAYGLEHAGGGLDGETIAVPAQFLLRPDGTVAWRHVSRRITDRADPADALRALSSL